MSAEEKLWEALAKAEREAAQPVVPGELQSWARAVRGELGDVAAAWDESSGARRSTAREILREDPALAARVEPLKAVEAKLVQRLEELRRDAKALCKDDLEDATGSEEALDAIRALRRALLEWIVDVRVHGAELGTWRDEATHRERGTVD